nr:MAG TPA: hypothetical protein [Caudoviricetes sp.]
MDKNLNAEAEFFEKIIDNLANDEPGDNDNRDESIFIDKEKATICLGFGMLAVTFLIGLKLGKYGATRKIDRSLMKAYKRAMKSENGIVACDILCKNHVIPTYILDGSRF